MSVAEPLTKPGGGPRGLPGDSVDASATGRRRRLADRVARWVVTIGGLGIIASILGILLFILAEVWPLTRPAEIEVTAAVPMGQFPAEVVVGNEHRSHVATLGSDGVVRIVDIGKGEVVEERALGAPPDDSGEQVGPVALTHFDQPSSTTVLAAASDSGWVVLAPLRFPVRFEDDTRIVEPRLGEPVWIPISPQPRPIRTFTGRLTEDGGASVAVQFEDGELLFVSREVETNMFSGETTEKLARETLAVSQELTLLEIDTSQRNLYAGTVSGEILWWALRGGELSEPIVVAGSPAEVTALEGLLGNKSVIVGQADGSLGVWSQIRDEDGEWTLVRIREFAPHDGAISLVRSSPRDKSFVVLDSGSEMALYNSTSERTMWRGPAPLPMPRALYYSQKADGVFMVGGGELAALHLDNPHPEISWKTLFGKVWYEGASEPAYVWQSTGATDEFESKMSLVPLLIGTLKGTVYSLMLAIPLGVFGAMYASQFMHPRLLRYIKPVVEVMAALPSVVLGFLAGLWLAPRLEAYFPALILILLALPVLMIVAGMSWTSLPRTWRERLPVGAELLLFCIVLALGCWLCILLSRPVEIAVFGGSFQTWLMETFTLPYDQRNAVVIGLAMGFAVIPIIFAISEDAFSNVPKNLIAGSLALGANRWETVTRVVLPSASPGIFSAIMVGFGRAVGETMIVLMATGNTPIMDWNPFNGFRTLSANIAVEIPEAPQFGTLYRVLFLAALLLFVLTFLVNTVAELVRIRLRKKYQEM
ncbi:MAG: ABC transporter permease subunit [Thermoanaerobaculia bacterium]|nr:ABC transporter permease subunit [Thermoanaerobaculia bacterium]